jgi:gamma-glutamyltranspeptidase/glutathione hydrolase
MSLIHWPAYSLACTATEVATDGGLVVGPDQAVADAGARVLAEGGNAIDAAIAMGFATGVVEPASAGIGGSATLALALRDPDLLVTVEGHMVTSRHAHPDQYPLAEDQEPELIEAVFGMAPVVGNVNLYGGKAVAVPGAVACLLAAHERYGRLARDAVIAPAVALAADGVPVSYLTAAYAAGIAPSLANDPGSAALFVPNGWPVRGPGSSPPDRLVQPAMARTLELIAAGGVEAFYRGEIAASILATVRAQGSVLDSDDFALYEPTIVDPAFEAPFAGTTIAAAPDAGLPTLMAALYAYEQLAPATEAEKAVAWVRAFMLAFEDRFRYMSTDPSVPVPWDVLRSQPWALARLAAAGNGDAEPDALTFSAVAPAARGGGGLRPARSPSGCTSHCTAVDREGNIASLTTTVLNAFGSRLVDPGTGTVLNSGMAYFDPVPGGMNSVRPSVKVFSAMTPVIVSDPERGPFLGVGASGGRRIISGVAQIVAEVVLHGAGLQAAIEAPHVHAESNNEALLDTLWSREVAEAVAASGYTVVPLAEGPTTGNFARANGILIDGAGRRHSGVDAKKPFGIAVGSQPPARA